MPWAVEERAREARCRSTGAETRRSTNTSMTLTKTRSSWKKCGSQTEKSTRTIQTETCDDDCRLLARKRAARTA